NVLLVYAPIAGAVFPCQMSFSVIRSVCIASIAYATSGRGRSNTREVVHPAIGARSETKYAVLGKRIASTTEGSVNGASEIPSRNERKSGATVRAAEFVRRQICIMLCQFSFDESHKCIFANTGLVATMATASWQRAPEGCHSSSLPRITGLDAAGGRPRRPALPIRPAPSLPQSTRRRVHARDGERGASALVDRGNPTPDGRAIADSQTPSPNESSRSRSPIPVARPRTPDANC